MPPLLCKCPAALSISDLEEEQAEALRNGETCVLWHVQRAPVRQVARFLIDAGLRGNSCVCEAPWCHLVHSQCSVQPRLRE